MSEEKMDFREWQAQNHADEDEDVAKVEQTYVSHLEALTFNIDKKGKNIVSRYKGQIVFIDRDSPYVVGEGETWVCKIIPDFSVYYALPLVKISLSEMLNYNEQLRENVLNALWKKNRGELIEMLGGRIRNEIQAKILEDSRASNEQEVRELNVTIDELRNELHSTKFQLDMQKKQSYLVDEEYISLSSDDPDETRNVQPGAPSIPATGKPPQSEGTPVVHSGTLQPASPPYREVPLIKRAVAVPVKYEVERIGEDSLRSPSFEDSRYFVHISPDYHTLVIRPSDEGPVYCIGHVIRLAGLGLVSNFTQKKSLPAEYSEQFEGMLVRL